MLFGMKSLIFTLLPITIAALIMELILQLIIGPVIKGPASINSIASINSPDKTYWHYKPSTVRDRGIKFKFNSWGFQGPEPTNAGGEVRKILVIGDSMPFAGRFADDKVFPRIAESIMNENKKRVEVMNASMPSFSLEQIKNFYLKTLFAIPHDIAILCFYIDDVNRELRYKKNGILYTPVWPEWIQDVFYSTHITNRVMRILGYRDTTFLRTRNLSYDEAWPNVFSILNEINRATQKQGVQFAIFNIPRFKWNGALMEKGQYSHIKKNEELEKWCKGKGTPYYDTLPMFLKINIDFIRISHSDAHFNEIGHKRMAGQLRNFLEKLINE